MAGLSEADRRYHWRATLERTNEVRDVIKEAGFTLQIQHIASIEMHADDLNNVVTIIVGIAPGTYEVRCTHGCLSLLRETLGAATYY
jgi:hypothetical protein